MIYEEASYRRRRSRLWTNENHLSSIEDCVTWPMRGRRASDWLPQPSVLSLWLANQFKQHTSNACSDLQKVRQCSPFNSILAALAYHLALIHVQCNLQALHETCRWKTILDDLNALVLWTNSSWHDVCVGPWVSDPGIHGLIIKYTSNNFFLASYGKFRHLGQNAIWPLSMDILTILGLLKHSER